MKIERIKEIRKVNKFFNYRFAGKWHEFLTFPTRCLFHVFFCINPYFWWFERKTFANKRSNNLFRPKICQKDLLGPKGLIIRGVSIKNFFHEL